MAASEFPYFRSRPICIKFSELLNFVPSVKPCLLATVTWAYVNTSLKDIQSQALKVCQVEFYLFKPKGIVL